ncbi:MAG: OadG family protein [Eubacteriales bacterium]|nr:OadG family protein [Eubacteriales bacterium]
MKKILSRCKVFVLILSLGLALGCCAKSVFAYSEEDVTQIAQYYFQSWKETDFQEYIDSGLINDEELLKQYAGWQEIKGQIGAFKEESEVRVEEVGNTIVVNLAEDFDNASLNFAVTFDKALAEQDPFSAIMAIDAEIPGAGGGKASMQKAGINTLMGMGIVFLVLVFISFVIGLLKYVPAFLEKKKSEETGPGTLSADSGILPVEEENVTSDTELVAVITAAIMALRAEEGRGDGSGFTVRSIRRRRG